MSPPASERSEPIASHVPVTHTLRPSYGARTAQVSVYRVADARSADLKSAVSQVCNLRIVGKIGRLGSDRCSADYKSAIRQIENLRYG